MKVTRKQDKLYELMYTDERVYMFMGIVDFKWMNNLQEWDTQIWRSS